jgi:hypothetical protein
VIEIPLALTPCRFREEAVPARGHHSRLQVVEADRSVEVVRQERVLLAGNACSSASTMRPGLPMRDSAGWKKQTTCGFARRAVAWFGRNGVAIQRLMSDNGSA